MRPKIRQAVYWIALSAICWTIPSKICLGESFTGQDTTMQVTEIRIDPTTAVRGVDAMLFDSIVYIPLETNKQSEFSAISQLEVTENYYIVLDQRLKTLFFFNRDGSFSHKIDKNNENKAFGSISRFSLDKSKNVLEFRDMQTPYTYTFGLNGDFINVQKKEFFRDFALFNGFRVGYRIDAESDSSHFTSILKYDDTTGQLLGSYLPVDSARKNVLVSVPKHFYLSERRHMYFTQPYDYTIYEFDSTAVPHERYKVLLPLENTVPNDFLSNPIYHGKWMDYLKADRKLIYSIRDVYVSGDWLTFYTSPSIKGSAFLYNLATYELFNLKETEDSSLGLPITESLRPILGVAKGALISEVSFLSLKQLYEDMSKSEQKDRFPQQLKVLMKKDSHNPILRLSYLKQDY